MPTFTNGGIPSAAQLNTIGTGINNLGVLLTGIAATRQVIPVCSSYINTTHSIASGSDIQAPFDNTWINEDYLFVPNVGHPVVNTAGVYVAIAQINWDTNATGVRAAHITLNGTSVPSNSVGAGSENPVTTAGVGTAYMAITPPMSLAVGAALYLLVFQSSGANLNLIPNESGTNLTVFRVGQ